MRTPAVEGPRVPTRGRLPIDMPARRHPTTFVTTAGRILTAASLIGFGVALTAGFEAMVLMLTIAGLVALVTTLRSPAVGLLGVALLCTLDAPIRAYVTTPYDLHYNSFNYVLLTLGVFAAPLVWRRKDLRIELLAAFVCLLTLQLYHSTNLRLGMHSILEVVASFGLIGCFMRAGVEEETLVWIAIVTSTAAACCLIAYYVSPPERSILVNALVHVPLAGLAAVALAVTQRVDRRWWLLGVLVTVNIALAFVTGSRGGFSTSALLALYILARSPKFRWKGYIVLLFGIMFVAAAVTWNDAYTNTVAKWFQLVDPDRTFSQASSSRSDIAEFGWTTFRANPMGIGTGSFTEASGDLSTLGRNLAAHSAWIKIMAENGVAGLAVFIAFIAAFATARPRGSAVNSALGPLVAVVTSVAFLSSEFQSKSIWLLVSGAIVLLQSTRRGATAPAIPPGGVRHLRSVAVKAPGRRGRP